MEVRATQIAAATGAGKIKLRQIPGIKRSRARCEQQKSSHNAHAQHVRSQLQCPLSHAVKLASSAMVVTRVNQSSYADKAVEQSIEYLHLGCKTGKSQWWSKDRQIITAGACSRSLRLVHARAGNQRRGREGRRGREKALAECAGQIEAEAEEPQDPDAQGPKRKWRRRWNAAYDLATWSSQRSGRGRHYPPCWRWRRMERRLQLLSP